MFIIRRKKVFSNVNQQIFSSNGSKSEVNIMLRKHLVFDVTGISKKFSNLEIRFRRWYKSHGFPIIMMMMGERSHQPPPACRCIRP